MDPRNNQLLDFHHNSAQDVSHPSKSQACTGPLFLLDKYIAQKLNSAQANSNKTSGVICFTGFIDFDNTVIRNLLEEAKKRDLMEAEARKHVIGSNVLDNDRCGGERR